MTQHQEIYSNIKWNFRSIKYFCLLIKRKKILRRITRKDIWKIMLIRLFLPTKQVFRCFISFIHTMRHHLTRFQCKLLIYVDEFLASIDCNIEQCAKPSKLYEELGCKAVYGAKSCCAKRFECPDFKKLDDNKCMFEGKEFALGVILPRNFTDNKCSETCFCTRFTLIFFFLLSSLNIRIFVEKQTSPPNFHARTATAACQVSKCPAALTSTET